MTNVEVIGGLDEDEALNVHFDDDEVVDAWFRPDLVEFVDHSPGTTGRIGDAHLVRHAEGGWRKVDDPKGS